MKIYYATTYSITLVRAVAAHNASLSMEKPASVSQLLPLPTGCWHPRPALFEALLKMSCLGVGHSFHYSISGYHIYLAPTSYQERALNSHENLVLKLNSQL